MRSKKPANSRRKRHDAPKRRGSRSTRWIVIAAVIAVAAATMWWLRTDHRGGASNLESPESVQKLLGSWQRTDAGYVIDIRSIGRDGAVDAAYLNPSPIHVSQARVSDAGGSLGLFVELMDVGYPGATYRLRYNAEYDALVGLYHQPTAGQDFEVAFVRK